MIRLRPLTLFLTALVSLAGCKSEPAEAPAATPEAPTEEAAAPAEEAAPEEAAPEAAATLTDEQKKLFAPLPAVVENADNPLTDAKTDLGRMLYFENRLSKNHDISCNTCHVLDAFGVDTRGKATSEGHKGQMGGRNSPTVYNAAGHFKQFWDGREPDVEAQAKGPILNPIEMAMPDEARVLETLGSMPEYVAAFEKAFPESKPAVTYDNLGKAIGAFERKLLTPSRFDEYLAGKEDALTDDEKRGAATFAGLGCTTCHNGAFIGGNSFQKLGLVEAYPDQKDLGLFEVTKNEADKMKFKVPSLRNIAKTGPYFHDGSLTDLPTVVRTMARHQLGKKDLTDAEVNDVVAFLNALTGEVPADYIKKPELPPSTDKTPKPDPS